MTFGFSWLFWIPAGLSGLSEPAWPVVLLHYLGGLVPLLAAVGLITLRAPVQERRDYWRRAVDFRRIGLPWYAVILLAAPALTGLAAVLDRLLGGSGGELEAAAGFIRQPLGILPFALFMLLFGPLPEELAWRGFALDRFQARYPALLSSLLLGAAWTVWHLPLFFIQGSYQHSLGVGTPGFWLFLLDKVPQSILMTWFYNNNRRSILSAVLFHFSVNFSGESFALSPRGEVFYILLWMAAAALVTLVWGPARLSREERPADQPAPLKAQG